MNASELCLLAAGIFFMTGLLTGTWKYFAMMRSESTQAPVYVDIAHRSSLMYAFAAILLREFVPYSPFDDAGTTWVVSGPLVFFGLAISTYVIHGVLNDTDNQLRRPHRLGNGTLPGWMIQGFMLALIVAEVGGSAILVWGFLRTLI